MNETLYARMRTHGTLSETPEDIPDAVFALPSTLNWMKAEAMLVTGLDVSFQRARDFYKRVQKRELTEPQVNSVYEQLLFSLNQVAALRGLAVAANKADVARVGIVTWYYGVYGAASAMIAAADGSFPETHATTALQWDRQFAAPKLAMDPFADRIGGLTAAEVELALEAPRARGKHPLTTAPSSLEQAWGCHAEYLSGTASWEQWNLEQRVRGSPDFKALGVDNFRTKGEILIGEEAFSFTIDEPLQRCQVRLRRGDPGYRRGEETWQSRHVPSGRLTVIVSRLTGPLPTRRWTYRPDRPLERQVDRLVRRFEGLPQEIAEEHVRREQWDKEWKRKCRRMAARYRWDLEAAERPARLRSMTENWHEARRMRGFLDALEAHLASAPSRALSRWLDWARDYAEELDPFRAENMADLEDHAAILAKPKRGKPYPDEMELRDLGILDDYL